MRLFVDANGAYSRKQALAQAEYFAEYGVAWFEEPVSSDDLEGLRLFAQSRAGRDGYRCRRVRFDLCYFLRMLEAGAVDVLQADATGCGGISGFLQVGALCDAFGLPLSARTRHADSTFTRAVRWAAPATWNIFTTTPALSECCSTAC